MVSEFAISNKVSVSIGIGISISITIIVIVITISVSGDLPGQVCFQIGLGCSCSS